MILFASAAKGTETALRDELNELGFTNVRAARGGVHFGSARRDAYRACLWSRVAMRVLEPVAEFDCADEDALYAGVFACELRNILTPRQTLSVSAACRSSRLTHTQYIAQRTKDALVDRQRRDFGQRSNVERDDPDVQIFVHLLRDRATVYLDHSGAPLHRRGYRKSVGEAPLKENLAAAVLRLSDFDPELPCIDPMCGSGTLLIEAGMAAAKIAPGTLRERFGFERWASYDASERAHMRELRERAQAERRAAVPILRGSDSDAQALVNTRENAQRAGVTLELSQAALGELQPAWSSGTLIGNPPYGERLRGDAELPRQLARLVDRFADYSVGLLLSEQQALGRTRRKPRTYELFNGNIPCTLRTYAPVAHDDSADEAS